MHLQINHAQALPTFCVCTIFALLLEFSDFPVNKSILSHKWTIIEIKWIILSALLAGCVNLCSYGLIGNTSTITFQVIGHIKTALILMVGYSLTRNQVLVKWSHLVGTIICVCGAVLYSYVRHAELVGVGYFELCTNTIFTKKLSWLRTQEELSENPL